MRCMLKLQFRLRREAQKVTQFFEFFGEITLLWYKILNTLRPWRRLQENEIKTETFQRGRKQNLWTLNLSFRNWEALSPEDIQQVNSVASRYGVQLLPNEAYLDGDWNTRAYSVYEDSDLIKSDQSPLPGECAALKLFLCYDIRNDVGVSGLLVRHYFSSYFLVLLISKALV